METLQLDNVDLKILDLLSYDAYKPYTEIAQEVHVSAPTVHVRMRKMEQAGVVKGAHLSIDYSKLGYDVQAFIGIYLKESQLYDHVIEQLHTIPEIVSANYTTGNYSIFAKILCKDTQHLMRVLHDKVQKVTGIERTETFISLQESIQRPARIS